MMIYKISYWCYDKFYLFIFANFFHYVLEDNVVHFYIFVFSVFLPVSSVLLLNVAEHKIQHVCT